MRSPEPRFSPVKTASFAALAVVLVLASIEAGTRVYHRVRNGTPQPIDLHAYWVDDSATGYALKPGYAAGGIRVNSLGFRGPEISRARADGVQRVVALGDSTTFGPREEECAYPYALGNLLGSNHAEVINAGIEGYRSDRALVHLKRDVLPLHPDLVTVLIGWNDLYQTDPFSDAQELALHAGPLQQLLSWSTSVQMVRQLYYQRLHGHLGLDTGANAGRLGFLQSYRPRAFAEHLHDIVEATRTAGADVVVFTWPTVLGNDMSAAEVARVVDPYSTRSLPELKAVYADYQAAVWQVASEDQVTVVDIARWFEGRPKADLFVDTLHFTCAGHALVADGLAPLIRARLDKPA